MAVNTVIASAYYARILVQTWFQPIPDGDNRPIAVTGSLGAAPATIAATMAFGVLRVSGALWRGIGAVGLRRIRTKIEPNDGRLP